MQYSLCCATLRRAIRCCYGLCYVTVCYALLRSAPLRTASLRTTALLCASLRSATQRHAALRFPMLCYTLLCPAMPFQAIVHNAMLIHVSVCLLDAARRDDPAPTLRLATSHPARHCPSKNNRQQMSSCWRPCKKSPGATTLIGSAGDTNLPFR